MLVPASMYPAANYYCMQCKNHSAVNAQNMYLGAVNTASNVKMDKYQMEEVQPVQVVTIQVNDVDAVASPLLCNVNRPEQQS